MPRVGELPVPEQFFLARLRRVTAGRRSGRSLRERADYGDTRVPQLPVVHRTGHPGRSDPTGRHPLQRGVGQQLPAAAPGAYGLPRRPCAVGGRGWDGAAGGEAGHRPPIRRHPPRGGRTHELRRRIRRAGDQGTRGLPRYAPGQLQPQPPAHGSARRGARRLDGRAHGEPFPEHAAAAERGPVPARLGRLVREPVRDGAGVAGGQTQGAPRRWRHVRPGPSAATRTSGAASSSRARWTTRRSTPSIRSSTSGASRGLAPDVPRPSRSPSEAASPLPWTAASCRCDHWSSRSTCAPAGMA